MKVAVLGSGAWGTALGCVAARGGADVVMWSFAGDAADFCDPRIKITRDMADLAGSDVVLVVTPAAFFHETTAQFARVYDGAPVIICTKGADPKTGRFMSEILAETMPTCRDFGVLSGPQFAAEVANRVPTASTLAGTERAITAGRAALPELHLVASRDIIGTQICGVGKNAVALISGYNSVAAAGENERAMIFTFAWNEVVDLGMAMGAEMRTFLGLCGIGDLFLSATSMTSRNFAGGAAIARGQPPAGTVEGIYALDGLLARAGRMNIATPTLYEMAKKMKLK